MVNFAATLPGDFWRGTVQGPHRTGPGEHVVVGKDIAADLAVVRVCTGEKCSKEKADKLRRKLAEAAEARGLQADIKVRPASCRDHCGKGPVVEVKPDGVVLRKLKPKKAGDLIEAIVNGTVRDLKQCCATDGD